MKSNRKVDRLDKVKEKASALTEAHSKKTSDSVDTKSDSDSTSDAILACSPNLHKQRSEQMSEKGFIKIPRAIIDSEKWHNLRLRQKNFFIYLLSRVQYRTSTYLEDGVEKRILPGQIRISYRNLVDDYNRETKFKEERIDVPFLQRCVSACHACGWLDTLSDTVCTIITITVPELYEHYKSLSDTASDTETIQRRYNEEERKNGRKVPFKKGTYVKAPDGARPPLSKKEKNYNFSKEDLEIMQESLQKQSIEIKEKDLIRWGEKYGPDYLMANLIQLFKTKKVDNPGGWMEHALKRDYAGANKNKETNHKTAIKFKKEMNWNDLIVTKNYSTIELTGYDISHILDPEIFLTTLKEKYQNLRRDR